jgi:hypothetical protein
MRFQAKRDQHLYRPHRPNLALISVDASRARSEDARILRVLLASRYPMLLHMSRLRFRAIQPREDHHMRKLNLRILLLLTLSFSASTASEQALACGHACVFVQAFIWGYRTFDLFLSPAEEPPVKLDHEQKPDVPGKNRLSPEKDRPKP